jgi:hypothetical protein
MLLWAKTNEERNIWLACFDIQNQPFSNKPFANKKMTYPEKLHLELNKYTA